ncbi:MAG TPA: DUF6682 family protein [Actinomycetes bacterium]|nr:DUF6682 family protein [Actinomycetes bacterium]
MAIAASTIITRVRKQLIDELTTKRWSDEELLLWLSDGQRTLVAMDPSLNVLTTPLLPVAGTKQVLPPNAFLLMDIQRNMGPDGVTPGRVVTVVSRENLDRVDPNWHASRRSDTIQHYIYDPKQPKTYYVYPPSTGGSYIDVARAEIPADFAALTDTMVIADLYQTALFDYVMFRAHQKDTDYSAGNEKAAFYLQLFQMFAAGSTQGLLDESANKQLGPADLTDKGAAA